MSGRSWAARVTILLGAVTAAVLTGTAALAAVTLELRPSHRDTTAADFKNHSCAQIPDGAQGPGKDGFVFVLPDNKVEFLSLALVFKTPGGTTENVTIPNDADPYPDGIVNQANATSKAFVVVPEGWILVNGTATISGETKADYFNLTHTCPGGPGPSPSPSKSRSPESSPSPSSSGSTGGNGGSTGGSGGGLPVTGTAVGGIVLTGLALVAGGVGLLFLVRRRRLVVGTDSATAEPDATA